MEYRGTNADEITPGDVRAVKNIWRRRADDAFNEMERLLPQFNEVYYILNNADVILLNAKGNSETASYLELNRFPQKKECSVYRPREIPAIEDWLFKDNISILTVSGSGGQEMVEEINAIYRKINAYPDFAYHAAKIKLIGITANQKSPLRDICNPFIVLDGNHKESSTNEISPSKYMGEAIEKKILMDLNAIWMIYTYKNKIPESVFKRRHKPRD